MKTRGGLVRGAWLAAMCLAMGAAACDSDTTTGGGAGGSDLDTVGGIGGTDTVGGVDDVGGISNDTGSKPGGDDTASTVDTGGGGGTTDTGGTGGGDTGTGGTPDVATTPDAGGTDTAAVVDVVTTPDTADTSVDQPDLVEPVEDVTEPEPDVPAGSCVAGEQCPVAPIGLPDVAIEQKSGAAPTLLGGSIPMGDYELTLAEIYLDSVNGGAPLPIQIDVKSNGNTFGAARFETEAWSVAANLDLFLAISIGNQSFTFEQGIGGGGCVTFGDNMMYSDLLECYDGTSTPDVPLPESFEYENAGPTLRIKVTVANAAILNAIPADYQVLAKAFIKDDLDIILELTSM